MLYSWLLPLLPDLYNKVRRTKTIATSKSIPLDDSCLWWQNKFYYDISKSKRWARLQHIYTHLCACMHICKFMSRCFTLYVVIREWWPLSRKTIQHADEDKGQQEWSLTVGRIVKWCTNLRSHIPYFSFILLPYNWHMHKWLKGEKLCIHKNELRFS